MRYSSGRWAAVALLALGAVGPAGVRADETLSIPVTIKDHHFTPAEIHVAAGQDVALEIQNEDTSAEEFDLRTLGIEEIVFPSGSDVVRIQAIKQGQYPFFGDYHPGTARGVVVAQ